MIRAAATTTKTTPNGSGGTAASMIKRPELISRQQSIRSWDDDDEASAASEDDASFQGLTREETQAVNRARLVMAAVLIGAAILFAVGIYVYTNQREWHEFTKRVSESKVGPSVTSSFLLL